MVANKGIVLKKGNTSNNGIVKESYIKWRDMLGRCKNDTSYFNCNICDDWLIYENFEKWYDNNIYKIENEKICLDKDILIKGNKIYSPDTCILIPEKINLLFIKSSAYGISKRKNGKYQASYRKNGKQTYIGTFENIEDAKNAYKKMKYLYIVDVLLEYKNKIPIQIYNKILSNYY